MLLPDGIISFCILDISQSGLAFCYNGSALKSKVNDTASVAFFDEKGGAADIPVTIISDTEFDKEQVKADYYDEEKNGDQSEIPYLRKCAVQFDSLSSDQKLTINEYIKSLKKS